MWKCKEWWNIQLTLGIWCRPLSQHPLPPARHQPHLLIPSAQSNSQKKLSAIRGANRTEALVSLYWSSRSLHPKEPPNQIWHKSTKVDSIRSSRTWKKSFQISKPYTLQHIKTFFPKNTRSTNAMTGVISGVVTHKDKTKSNPLARLKVRIFSKSVVSF